VPRRGDTGERTGFLGWAVRKDYSEEEPFHLKHEQEKDICAKAPLKKKKSLYFNSQHKGRHVWRAVINSRGDKVKKAIRAGNGSSHL
jgi:hypothetical protein